WDKIKAEEKARTSVLDGIPATQGALARTQKVMGRARRGGLDVGAIAAPYLPSANENGEASAAIGAELLATILQAERLGIEAEGALRATMRALEAAIRSAEGQIRPDPASHSPQLPGSPALGDADTTRR
ncbi:MAG: hypothetical protein LBJ08_10805, partial [Bifidobacteriaceae bacterium]|nr:hypothetical protein [Bifidobacteriaceae bacterium]